LLFCGITELDTFDSYHVTLMVGTTALTLSELEGSITIDTPLKEA